MFFPPLLQQHAQELRNARDAIAPTVHGPRDVFRRRATRFRRPCAASVLTYSVLVFQSEGTHWPPFSKPTAFSVKTMKCACVPGSVAGVARTPAHRARMEEETVEAAPCPPPVLCCVRFVSVLMCVNVYLMFVNSDKCLKSNKRGNLFV